MRIYRETHMVESLFNKVTGISPATLLNEMNLTQVFFDEFCKIFKTLFYGTLPDVCVCSMEKYFSNKIVKSPLKKR